MADIFFLIQTNQSTKLGSHLTTSDPHGSTKITEKAIEGPGELEGQDSGTTFDLPVYKIDLRSKGRRKVRTKHVKLPLLLALG